MPCPEEARAKDSGCISGKVALGRSWTVLPESEGNQKTGAEMQGAGEVRCQELQEFFF